MWFNHDVHVIIISVHFNERLWVSQYIFIKHLCIKKTTHPTHTHDYKLWFGSSWLGVLSEFFRNFQNFFFFFKKIINHRLSLKNKMQRYCIAGSLLVSLYIMMNVVYRNVFNYRDVDIFVISLSSDWLHTHTMLFCCWIDRLCFCV